MNYSVMQVFVSSQEASATVSLPDLSVFLRVACIWFSCGDAGLVGRSAYLSITIFFEITERRFSRSSDNLNPV
ncbi:MAG: hypothetical protein ACBR12_06975 [Microcoleus sp.]|uniref:hypothetical protein n=3 Tax=Microcoleus sp. TaxID=44472 RepID=UPI003523A967